MIQCSVMGNRNNLRFGLVRVKKHVRHLTPEWAVLLYHFFLAVVAWLLYLRPSRELVVIGVTGTKGKTSTALFIHAALTVAGEKVGLFSTVETRIGEKVYPNTEHMTMRGRGYVQKYLRRMVDAGCGYAVIETPSEGIRQFRVLGVHFDSLVFTNLSSEHLVTHGTFERYRDTKGKLFRNHARSPRKLLKGKPVKRFVCINGDDAHAGYFNDLSDSALTERLLFGTGADAAVRVRVEEGSEMNTFSLEGEHYAVPFPGLITVRNAVPAILLARRYTGVSPEKINRALASVTLPGRLERIEAGQLFSVFCDYAHEPLSIASVYEALKGYVKPGGRVIMVVGAVGASRWKYNAREIGETAAAHADVTVVTDVDPFSDDPREILDAVVAGVKQHAGVEWYAELDRRKAIRRALSMTRESDVVIITGKGAEVTMEVQEGPVPWDERAIIREEIQRVLH